jgi:CubicO group peptidase (beta-lactamase class C family)
MVSAPEKVAPAISGEKMNPYDTRVQPGPARRAARGVFLASKLLGAENMPVVAGRGAIRDFVIRHSSFVILLMTACAPTPPPLPGPERLEPVAALVDAAPAVVGLHPGLPAQLDSILEAALAEGAAPGAAVAVGRHGRLVHLNAYGRIDAAADAPPVDVYTLFDLASLTKVVGTTAAAMLLEEQGLLDLERRVVDYLPEFDHPEKAPITVRMLLEHRAGLEPFARLFTEFRGREQYLEQINRRPLRRPPGTEAEYSDWDLILLQLVIERITDQTLDVFLHERVFAPLAMQHTLFNPPAALRPRIAATEVDVLHRGGLIHGEVHDPNAWAMGGVAGHAGLFGTIGDLAIFAQTMLNGGEYNGVRLLRPQTVARWTAPRSPGSSRALGWDTPGGRSSAGRFFGPRSFGHTGYTGTSLWIDPERGLFVILLTNRVNPTAENPRHIPLRRALADAVQAAILDAPLIDWEARRE